MLLIMYYLRVIMWIVDSSIVPVYVCISFSAYTDLSSESIAGLLNRGDGALPPFLMILQL